MLQLRLVSRATVIERVWHHALFCIPSANSVAGLTGSGMSRTLELNCWVFGDDLNSVFEVEIQDSKKVSTLRKFIKAEKSNTFQHVEADTIDLWKVTLLMHQGQPS